MVSFRLLGSACAHVFRKITSCKHVRVMYSPYTPLLYSKTGVNRSSHCFLNFALKHRFNLKIIVFTAVKNCSILHGRVCVMTWYALLQACVVNETNSVFVISIISDFSFECSILVLIVPVP